MFRNSGDCDAAHCFPHGATSVVYFVAGSKKQQLRIVAGANQLSFVAVSWLILVDHGLDYYRRISSLNLATSFYSICPVK